MFVKAFLFKLKIPSQLEGSVFSPVFVEPSVVSSLVSPSPVESLAPYAICSYVIAYDVTVSVVVVHFHLKTSENPAVLIAAVTTLPLITAAKFPPE